MTAQYCPICKQEVQSNPRYTNYVCSKCVALATDADGRRVDFYNETIMGTGVMGKYTDTQENYAGYDCYIAGVKCWADEARFGGIVVQLAGEDQGGVRDLG
jgi:hypothetical protein